MKITIESMASLRERLTQSQEQKFDSDQEHALNLENLYLSTEDMQLIIEATQDLKFNLTSLYLKKCLFDFKGAQALAKTLESQHCKVQSINLSENNIGHEGTQVLAKSLQHKNCKVQSIDLSKNPIGDVGAQALAEALQHENCKVQSINLSYNNIGSRGAQALTEALQHENCKVQSIDLSWNEIDDAGAQALAEALQHENCKVQSIDLTSWYPIGNAGARALAQALIYRLDQRKENIVLKTDNETTQKIQKTMAEIRAERMAQHYIQEISTAPLDIVRLIREFEFGDSKVEFFRTVTASRSSHPPADEVQPDPLKQPQMVK